MGKVLEKKPTMEPGAAMTACREALALLPEPAAMLDESGMVASVNPAFSELVGCTCEGLAGAPFEDLLDEGPPGPSPLAGGRRVKTGLKAKDGGTVPVDLSVARIDGGALILVRDRTEAVELRRELAAARECLDDFRSGIFRMIKDLDQSERELDEAYGKLQETQAQLIQSVKLNALGELAAGVAHEVGQPLTVVKGLAQNLLRRLPTRGDDREKLELIVEASKKMEAIVSHLRFFTRSSGPEQVPLDVNPVVRDAFLMLAELMHKHGIDVRLDLHPVPTVMGSPTRLEQVIINLATNARDAMPEGGVLTVTTEHRSEGGRSLVSIEVRDTGRGIPADALERVFDPFFTTKPAGKGTGLGLSISSRIIEEHGGTIRVDSREGRGATFRITLPAAE
ncbi:MAG: ATP-binding protein [Thermodesulfobacteriota bacterium]